MATTRYDYGVFNLSEVRGFLQDLRHARDTYSGDEEVAVSAAGIFAWLGFIGAPAVVAVPVSLISTTFSTYYRQMKNNCQNAIETLEKYEDLLQSGKYDLVEMRGKAYIEAVGSKKYYLPVDFKCTRIHGGSGWVYPVG